MASEFSSADTGAQVLERLVGESGEPERIEEAARKLAQRALGIIADNINQHLAFPIELELESVDLGRFAQAFAEAGEGNAAVIAPSALSPDALILDLDAEGVSLLVGAFLGADPELPAGKAGRALSRIDLEVSTALLREVVAAINGSGSRSLKLQTPAPAAITGPEIAKQVLRDGPSACMKIVIRAANAEGRLKLTMPQRVLLTSRSEAQTSPDAVAEGAEPAAGINDWSERLGQEVRKSSVSLNAVVPLSKMSLGKLSTLEVGQILEVPASSQSLTRLSSRNKTLFICEFGKLGPNYSVRIKHAFDERKDFVDGLLSR